MAKYRNKPVVIEEIQWFNDGKAAIDNLPKLKRQRDDLLAALRPFADEAGRYDPDENDSHEIPFSNLTKLTIGDLRRARAAIAAAEADS